MTGAADVRIAPDSSIREALEHIDRNAQQIAFVVDSEGRLVGAVSDGDIRRALLGGATLQDFVARIMNSAPAAVATHASQRAVDEMKASRGIRVVAVVDDDGVLIDVVGDGGRIATDLSTPAVLMAGGRGQRLYPITKEIPKPLVPLGDDPMIDIILHRLRAQGFRRVHISVNHLGHLIEEHVGDGGEYGLEVSYLHEPAPLGTAGALAQLDGELDEPFIVMNSDLLTQVDLRAMLHTHRDGAADATVGVREYGFEIPFGVVRTDGGRVTGLAEKPMHRELVSAGIYALSPQALHVLERDEYCDMPTLLTRLIEGGRTVGAFELDGEWIDVGRPDDLERARQAWQRSRR